MHRSANFRTVLPKSQNANPLDVKPETDFNAKYPCKVIHFGVNEETDGLHSAISFCGIECDGPEDIASERRE